MTAPTRITGPGSYDLPAETYHADPAPAPSLSSTLARAILFQSPLHAWAQSPRMNPHHEPVQNDAFSLGNAAHTALLAKGQPFVCSGYDDFRTKAAREEREELEAQGCVVLRPADFERVEMMVRAARVQLDLHKIGDVFRDGVNERSHFAEIDGVWCRCMTDNMTAKGRIIYDYKTTAASAAPEAAIRTICNYGYDVQAAHYRDVVRAVTGENWRFRFVIQEKSDPFALSVTELSEDWLTTAGKKAARARELWRMCLERYGEAPWPGYPAVVAVVDAPTWHESRWLDREEAEADYRRATGKDVLTAALEFQAPFEGAA